MVIKQCFVFILLIVSLLSKGQSNLAVKYFGMSIHPFGDKFAHHQPYKLDKNAHVVFNYGAFIEYEKFVYEQSLSIKAAQGVFSDCSGGMAGATFLGLKALVRPMGRHRIGVAIGPLLIMRRSWSRFDDYKGSKIFKEVKDSRIGDYQYAFYPYGIDVEYDYQLSKRCDFSVSFTPGVPFVMTFAAGVKYWFSRDFKEKEHKLLKLK